MITFIHLLTVLAWIIIPISAFVVVGRLIAEVNYKGSAWETLDNLRRVKRTFPVGLWFWLLVISIAWLIAQRMS